jgi:cell cycle control protein 50
MWGKVPDQEVQYQFGVKQSDVTKCVVQFELPEDFGPPVFFYYRLSNFFQNHRRYVASFNDKQLKGDAVSGSEINGSSCDPLRSDPGTGKPYYPCGLIANSIFNDSFTSPLNIGGNDPEEYKMENNTDIAWGSDKELYGKTKYKPDDVMPPPNWRSLWPDGYKDDLPPPDLSQWQAFMVWMRTAGLPTFSKLYQRNDRDAMKQGTYRVIIDDREWLLGVARLYGMGRRLTS